MSDKWTLTREPFDALLAWLDPDREQAGQKYEDIRRRLIKIFTCRGCAIPEDLADESINRVIRRLKDIREGYTGDRALYFYGVANKVFLEYVKRPPAPAVPLPVHENSEEVEQEYVCLERCVEHLPPENRELVIRYYQKEKRAKIDDRKQLAKQLGIALNALRIRAHRIRVGLQRCMQECLERQEAS
jgi:DNA-directed RNA polymerase specialized sigma24 family protein